MTYVTTYHGLSQPQTLLLSGERVSLFPHTYHLYSYPIFSILFQIPENRSPTSSSLPVFPKNSRLPLPRPPCSPRAACWKRRLACAAERCRAPAAWCGRQARALAAGGRERVLRERWRVLKEDRKRWERQEVGEKIVSSW